MNTNLQKPANNSNGGQMAVVSQYSEFSGPLPHPEVLARYEDIVPGAAERILKMAENGAEARIRNESKLVDNEVKLTKNVVRSSFLGMFLAFASVVVLAALEYFALVNEYPKVALSIIAVIASVAGIFILFRNRKPSHPFK